MSLTTMAQHQLGGDIPGPGAPDLLQAIGLDYYVIEGGYMRALTFALLVLTGHQASAEYAITGPAMTSVCGGFGIQVCSIREVVGVEQAGRVFPLSLTFAEVDEYQQRKDLGRCTIFAKGANGWRLGPHNDPSKSVRLIALDGKGKPEFINADKITFKCARLAPELGQR